MDYLSVLMDPGMDVELSIKKTCNNILFICVNEWDFSRDKFLESSKKLCTEGEK